MVSVDSTPAYAHRSLYLTIINGLKSAPDGQISPTIRERVSQISLEGSTDLQLYEFLVSLSREPITEISGFVREMCSLNKHYSRPIE